MLLSYLILFPHQDANGRRPGDKGFIPPSWTDGKGHLLPSKPQSGLDEGCYDEDYVDKGGRRVGEKGLLLLFNFY